MAIIRVLVAEDSATQRRYLADLINESPGLEVIGEARNGEEVVALVEELRPDVISMDVRMPRLDGLEATRLIMAQCPTPVVVVSGLLSHEVDLSFEAVEAGALAVVEKPPNRDDSEFMAKHHQLMHTLKAMAGVRVIRHWDHLPQHGASAATNEHHYVMESPTDIELIAIGASAGGPSALYTLLSGLPLDLPVGVVIAQHMPPEFVAGLARWLNSSTALPVRVAEDGNILEAGVVHLAPGGGHLKVAREKDRLVTHLLADKGSHRYHPSINVLFDSVATACGATSIGVVLTGMGDDGARGLSAMREVGARTFAQDENSCIVFGMPKAAIEHNAVERVLPLNRLSAALVDLL